MIFPHLQPVPLFCLLSHSLVTYGETVDRSHTLIVGPITSLYTIYRYYTLTFIFGYAIPAANRANIYNTFPQLKTYIIICIVLSVLNTCFSLYTRKTLVEFKSNAPGMIIALYIYTDLINVYAEIGAYSIVQEPITIDDTLPVVVFSVVGAVVIILNWIYFKKRSVLFSE